PTPSHENPSTPPTLYPPSPLITALYSPLTRRPPCSTLFPYTTLFRSLANQPVSTGRDDGLELYHTRVFSAVRCAPPANKPTPQERDNCAPWLHREVALLRPSLRVVVALGQFAWNSWWPTLTAVYGLPAPTPRPRFGHGELWFAGGAPRLLGCYHVSQQNTFTG